jgi:hypothetical protein
LKGGIILSIIIAPIKETNGICQNTIAKWIRKNNFGNKKYFLKVGYYAL